MTTCKRKLDLIPYIKINSKWIKIEMWNMKYKFLEENRGSNFTDIDLSDVFVALT